MSEPKGLHGKYVVFKRATDQTTRPGFFYTDGEPIEGCFVLRPEKDIAARSAILQYASMTTDMQLRQELRNWIRALDGPTELEKAHAEGRCPTPYYHSAPGGGCDNCPPKAPSPKRSG